jgi:hypothetical protein
MRGRPTYAWDEFRVYNLTDHDRDERYSISMKTEELTIRLFLGGKQYATFTVYTGGY